MKKRILFGTLFTLFICTSTLQAQEKLYSQSLTDAPLEQIVDIYNEWTGLTLIIQADLKPTINLKYSKLTKEEAMQAIETVLSMNGVALVPMGEKFLKVVPIATARQEGMSFEPFDPDTKKYAASDNLISQIIPLRYVVFADVQALIQSLIHGYGKVIEMERINSVLITDTSHNIARIAEAIAMIDQPLEKIEPRIYQLQFATADSVASKLKELIDAATPKAAKQPTTVANPRAVPGVVRANRTAVNSILYGQNSDDETQMIQGEVKLVSDKRTNIIIIFSKEANFDFFDRIIKVLDVPVDPEVVVETINLEYAVASEISGILNEFIGAAKETEETKGATTEGGDGSKTVEEVIKQRSAPKREISSEAKSAIGRLSADTKILSDERTNSLLLMGRRSDLEAIKDVIASLDVMLEQVLIETVILAVGLDDSISTGVQWVYQNQPGYGDVTYRKEVRDVTTTDTAGLTTTTPTVFEVPEYVDGKLNRAGFDAADLAENMAKGALSYFGSFPQINLEMIIDAAKSDGDVRVLSTPVVLTTDNTEAKITIADERPVITSSTGANSGYSARSTYQYKTIGIDLTVTPHINPDRFVLMEIKQSADDVGGNVQVDGNDVPIIQKREISATVAVQDRETIILGGLVRNSKNNSATKIPILGDIPLIGWLFSSRSKSEAQSELVVLITPYVLTSPAEASAEAKRRLEASDSRNTVWPKGWSQSLLSNEGTEKNSDPKFLESILGDEVEPEVEPKAEIEPESEVVPELESEPEPAAELESTAELESKSEPEPAIVLGPDNG